MSKCRCLRATRSDMQSENFGDPALRPNFSHRLRSSSSIRFSISASPGGRTPVTEMTTQAIATTPIQQRRLMAGPFCFATSSNFPSP